MLNGMSQSEESSLASRMQHIDSLWQQHDRVPSLPILMEIFHEAMTQLTIISNQLEEVRAENARLALIARY